MIYPSDFEKKIDFDKIRYQIKLNCISEAAHKLVDKIIFSNNINLISKQLNETNEMIDICLLKDNYPANSYQDISQIISKLNLQDSVLEVQDLMDLLTIINNARLINNFFKLENNKKYIALKQITDLITIPLYVHDRIEQVISKNGQIKDNASNKLKEIRRTLAEQKNLLNKRLNYYLNYFKESGWLSDDLSATMVNSRLVLPIETTYKRKINCIIHAESATGKTSYVEPQEILILNNEINELERSELNEIQNILFSITNDIRTYVKDLSNLSNIILYMDFVRAKAKLAINISAIVPQLSNEPEIDLSNARHPLLEANLKKENKLIVPLSLKIDNNNRIILISGPNAGGKSVSLKTMALMSYMLQCGLPIPVGGTTLMGIFDNIFLDLGDQQSIENDLSTYSSHLQNMKYFLKNANDKTLILIDEFGAGTDPITGGLIAEVILEELNNKIVKGIITTHYPNLKIFAANTQGIQNAAMHIEPNKLVPTFVLEQGIPGNSYAIEIAQNIGFEQKIILKAKEKIGGENISIDKFLRQTIRDKKYWERKRENIKNQEKKLEQIISNQQEELDKLKASKKDIISNAKYEANTLLNSVNKKIENTIHEIKVNEANKEVVKQLRNELQLLKQEVKDIDISEKSKIEEKFNLYKKNKTDKSETTNQEFVKIDKTKINIASKVRIKDSAIIGEVVEINKKNVVIACGNMYSFVKIEKLEKISDDEYNVYKKTANAKNNNYYDSYTQVLLNFKPYIDVRGLQTEEALVEVVKLVDQAMMLNIKEIKILHGRGTGVLRNNIRQYLNSYADKLAYCDEDNNFGGDGITIVNFL